MKNVLILTFQFADNYGAMLQAYSLKCEIEALGFQTDVANYVSTFNKSEYSRNPFVLQGSFTKKIKRVLKIPIAWKQVYLFNQFRNKYLGLGRELKRNDLEKLAKDYDILVVGSDQVWNGKLTCDNTTYFLDFGEGIKRIAYAASLGTINMTDFQKMCLKKYVSKFDAVSIREEINLTEVRQFIPKAESVVDPVFLNIDRWKQLTKYGCQNIKEKYILFYSLGGSKDFIKIAENVSEKYSLRIIAVHPTTKRYHIKGRQVHNIGPVDFLSLIEGASIVCSDSFHATCFSIIFGKLLCYKTNEKNPGRAESLLRQIKLISDDTSKENLSCQIIDCSKIDRTILEQEITKSKRFLREALN